jgi:hypothetical protein
MLAGLLQVRDRIANAEILQANRGVLDSTLDAVGSLHEAGRRVVGSSAMGMGHSF